MWLIACRLYMHRRIVPVANPPSDQSHDAWSLRGSASTFLGTNHSCAHSYTLYLPPVPRALCILLGIHPVLKVAASICYYLMLVHRFASDIYLLLIHTAEHSTCCPPFPWQVWVGWSLRTVEELPTAATVMVKGECLAYSSSVTQLQAMWVDAACGTFALCAVFLILL